MVEVFKTNVQEVAQAKKIASMLLQHFPDSKINFDLDDCDKVLRIEAKNCISEKVMRLVNENGFKCRVLE